MRKKPETVDNTINQGVISIVTFLKKMSDDIDFLKNSVDEIQNYQSHKIDLIEALKSDLQTYFRRNYVGLNKNTKNEINSLGLSKKFDNLLTTVSENWAKYFVLADSLTSRLEKTIRDTSEAKPSVTEISTSDLTERLSYLTDVTKDIWTKYFVLADSLTSRLEKTIRETSEAKPSVTEISTSDLTEKLSYLTDVTKDIWEKYFVLVDSLTSRLEKTIRDTSEAKPYVTEISTSDLTEKLGCLTDITKDVWVKYFVLVDSLTSRLEKTIRDTSEAKPSVTEISTSDLTERLVELIDIVRKNWAEYFSIINSLSEKIYEICDKSEKTNTSDTGIISSELVEKFDEVKNIIRDNWTRYFLLLNSLYKELDKSLRNLPEKSRERKPDVSSDEITASDLNERFIEISNLIKDNWQQYFVFLQSLSEKLDNALTQSVKFTKETPIKNDQDLVEKLSSIEVLIIDIKNKIAKKAKSDASDDKEVTKINTSNIETLTKSLTQLSNTVSRKTNVALRRFIKLINTLTSKDMAGQVKVSAVAFTDLSKQLSTIGNGLEKADNHMKKFMKGLTVFTMFMLSPTFNKSVSVFTKLMDAINKPKTTNVNKQATQWKWIFFTLALGIGTLVLALMNLENINWGKVLYLVGFLAAVSAAMYFGTRNMRNLTSVTGINKVSNTQSIKLNNNNNLALQMLMLSVGLGVLLLAIDAIRDIDWGEAGKLILFLLAVQTIMVISNVIIGRKGAGLKGGMGILGFAIGISILLLAIDAGKEVFFGSKPFSEDPKSWIGPWAVVGFIFIMALILGKSGIGRGNGGAAAQMLKFSLGFAILLLAIDAGKEVFNKAFKKGEWYGVWGAIGFVLLMTFALGKSGIGKGNGGAAGQMIKFAAGLVILVGALWLLTELVSANGFWKTAGAVAILAGTVWGLSFIVNQMSKQLKGVKRKQVYEDLLLLAAVAGLGTVIYAVIAAVQRFIGADNTKILGAILIIMGTVAGLAYGVYFVNKIIEEKKLTPAKIKKAEKFIIESIGIFALGVLVYAMIAATQKYLSADNAKVLGATQIIMLTLVEMLGLVWGVTQITKKMKESDITKGILIVAAAAGLMILASIVYVIIAESQKGGVDNGKILGATQIMVLTIVEVLALVLIIGAITSNPFGAAVVGAGMTFMAALVGIVLMAAAALYIIGKSEADADKVQFFVDSTTKILLLFTNFTLPQMLAMLGMSLVAVPLVASALIMALTLALISAVNLEDGKIELFIESSRKIFLMYTQFSLGEMLAMVGLAIASLPLVVNSLLMAGLIALISAINIKSENVDLFIESTAKIFRSYTDFSLVEMLAMVGTSIASLPLIINSLLMAGLLSLISAIKIEPEQIDRFNDATGKIFRTYASFSLKEMLKMAGTAVASLPLVISALAVAGTLHLLGKTQISKQKTELFISAIKDIFKAYSSFTLREMLKMAGTAEAAMPIATTALAMSHVLKNLTEVDVSQQQIDKFTTMVVDFVKNFAETMEETSSDALKKMRKSGDSLTNIVDMAKGFVDVLIAIANGKIGKYEVDPVTGQAKLVDFEKFDLDNISVDAGHKLGKLMADFASAYAGALEMSRKEAKRAGRASEVLAGLSPVFETVANLVSDVEKTKFLTDESLMTSISKNMQNFVLESKVTLQHINGLDVKQEKFKLFKDLVQTFTQDIKWELAIKNTDKFGESVGTVVKNINGLDLKKAIQMQNIVDSFTKMSNLKGLRDQIKEMTEMLKELNRYNENISESALNVSKQTEQAVKNQEATQELVKNLGNGAVTTQDLFNIVNQIVSNMVVEILRGIGANTYDVNVKNRVKVDDKAY